MIRQLIALALALAGIRQLDRVPRGVVGSGQVRPIISSHHWALAHWHWPLRPEANARCRRPPLLLSLTCLAPSVDVRWCQWRLSVGYSPARGAAARSCHDELLSATFYEAPHDTTDRQAGPCQVVLVPVAPPLRSQGKSLRLVNTFVR